MSDTGTKVSEIFQAMPSRLNTSTAAGMNKVIQYDLTGDGGGTYHCAIADGSCEVNEGAHDAPDMTVTMEASDFVSMIDGSLDGMSAFMSGKLRVSGDMGLAMKMQTLFN